MYFHILSIKCKIKERESIYITVYNTFNYLSCIGQDSFIKGQPKLMYIYIYIESAPRISFLSYPKHYATLTPASDSNGMSSPFWCSSIVSLQPPMCFPPMKTLGTVDCPVSPCSVSCTCLSAAPNSSSSTT